MGPAAGSGPFPRLTALQAQPVSSEWLPRVRDWQASGANGIPTCTQVGPQAQTPSACSSSGRELGTGRRWRIAVVGTGEKGSFQKRRGDWESGWTERRSWAAGVNGRGSNGNGWRVDQRRWNGTVEPAGRGGRYGREGDSFGHKESWAGGKGIPTCAQVGRRGWCSLALWRLLRPPRSSFFYLGSSRSF